MWFRLLKASFRRGRSGLVLTLVSTTLGVALVAALVAVSAGISEKISAELNRYGANILVKPAGSALLSETDVAGLKSSIFWRHNITGVSPYLYSTGRVSTPSGASAPSAIAGVWFDRPMPGGENFRAGMRGASPYLSVKGRWPHDGTAAEALIGRDLATYLRVKPGDTVTLAVGARPATATVTGIVTGGGYEDGQVFVPLGFMQRATGQAGKVSQVLVSAVTVPLDAFGRRDPKTMTRREYDKWYCTAYVTSVSTQVQQTMKGSVATPVWKVVEAQGKVLGQLSVLIYSLVALSLAAASLAVATTMTSDVLRRRRDVGLLKALGGPPSRVVSVFVVEAAFAALVAGALGCALGWALASYLGEAVFGTPFQFGIALLPISLASAVLITGIGAIVPLRNALAVPPAEVMQA